MINPLWRQSKLQRALAAKSASKQFWIDAAVDDIRSGRVRFVQTIADTTPKTPYGDKQPRPRPERKESK